MNSIIESCAGWNGGDYDENPKHCATNAISVLMPYFYSRDWWEQHIDTPEAYQRWRTAIGAFYLDVQDTRDLYYLNQSFAHGWLGDTPGFNGDLDRGAALDQGEGAVHLQPAGPVLSAAPRSKRR